METEQQEFYREQREFNRKLIERLDAMDVEARKRDAALTQVIEGSIHVVSALGDRINGSASKGRVGSLESGP